MLSVGTTRFEVGQGEMGGYTTLPDRAWRLAVAAGYRKGLVSAVWPILLLSCANGHRKRSFHFVGAPFLAFQAPCSLEERSLDGGPRGVRHERNLIPVGRNPI